MGYCGFGRPLFQNRTTDNYRPERSADWILVCRAVVTCAVGPRCALGGRVAGAAQLGRQPPTRLRRVVVEIQETKQSAITWRNTCRVSGGA
jgi:hypothetical protein